MYARISQFQMNPDRRAEAVRLSDEIIPDMKDDPGFRHIYVLADESKGEGIVITLWESAEDEQTSRAKVSQRFGKLGDVVVGQPQPSRVYEVLTEG